mmetsp:Transcript_42139/g.106554  ORF Transcript_42139/g.106554 Transcript_42139/m.106554 type:complete len:86 (+) Transcript_42139:63-320(+)
MESALVCMRLLGLKNPHRHAIFNAAAEQQARETGCREGRVANTCPAAMAAAVHASQRCSWARGEAADCPLLGKGAFLADTSRRRR